MKTKILVLFGAVLFLTSCSCSGPSSSVTTSGHNPTHVEKPESSVTIGNTSSVTTSSVTVIPTTVAPTTTITPTTVTPTTITPTTATPTTSVAIKELDFEGVVKAFDDSEPTIVNTSIYYYDANYGINLTFNSTLTIEYDLIVESQFTYSYQKLNDLSLDFDSEMISTYSGTIYGYNKNFGQYENDEIKWYTSLNGQVDTLSLNLDKTYFESISFKDSSMFTSVKDGSVDAFVGSDEALKATNMEFACKVNGDGTVNSVNLSYIDSRSAQVDIITTYSYDYIDVVVPRG